MVTLNICNISLDAECFACGSSKDRRWYARANAKSPGTLAQGRPLGSLLAWLGLPGGCPGSKEAHDREWDLLPYHDRVDWRRRYKDLPEWVNMFRRERSPRRDGTEPDGEPMVVP